ncbi:MAG: OmpH family outer membrane protein [Veillonellales bacterium]
MNMKIGKRIRVLFLAVAVTMLGTVSEVSAAGQGYVNMNAVITASPDFQQVGKSILEEQARLQQEFNEKSKEMTDQEKMELKKTLSQQLAETQQKLLQPVQEKLKQAIKNAAKAKDIDFVVPSESVLYGGVDLTADVQANMKK